MSVKRNVATPDGFSSAVLGKLRDVQIVISKPLLPAEILSVILDYSSVPDLMNCARVSKRLREMVYDDTRWVRKLSAMGCWNVVAARQQTTQQHDMDDYHEESRSTVQRRNGSISNTLPAGLQKSLTPESPYAARGGDKTPTLDKLDALDRVQSIRGGARNEYGKVYAALNPFYKDAITAKHPTNAKIFRTYRDPNHQAQMVSQVMRFAKSDESIGQEARKEKLDAISRAFEDAVANEFESALESGDVSGKMKKYANVLITLNGGERAIGQFFGVSRLLQESESLGEPLDCVNVRDGSFLTDELQNYFRKFAKAFSTELQTIVTIFPPGLKVAERFSGKVVKSVLHPYLSELFNHFHTKSSEGYARAVSESYGLSSKFVEDLILPPQSIESVYSELFRTINSIFSEHAEKYFAEELAYFSQRSETEVGAWERQLSQQDASIESLYMANINRHADKRDFMKSFKKVLMMPVNVFPTFSGNKSEAERGRSGSSAAAESPAPEPSNELVPPSSNRTSRAPSPLPTTELAAKTAIMKSRLEGIRSLFSLEVALSLVHMAKASIDRVTVFATEDSSFQDDAKNCCERVFTTLLQTLGQRHIETGFDQAVDHLSKYNPRALDHAEGEQNAEFTPLMIFLELVNVGDLIQQMVDVFYEQELVSNKLIDRNDTLRPAAKEKRRFEQMLDDRVAAGLNKGIEVLIADVDYLCATTQELGDFNPEAVEGQDKNHIDVGPTKTARSIVDVVRTHTNMLVGSTEKNLLDVFNQEVGLRLFNSLCKHLKRQRISVTGSIRIISDMNHYFSFVQGFKNKDLLLYFKALREVSQLYIIDPKDAKELATMIADTDRFSGIFRAEEVYEFAERRADWYTIKPRVEKAMYGIGCYVM